MIVLPSRFVVPRPARPFASSRQKLYLAQVQDVGWVTLARGMLGVLRTFCASDAGGDGDDMRARSKYEDEGEGGLLIYREDDKW